MRQFMSRHLERATTYDHVDKVLGLLAGPNRARTDPIGGGAVARVDGVYIVLDMGRLGGRQGQQGPALQGEQGPGESLHRQGPSPGVQQVAGAGPMLHALQEPEPQGQQVPELPGPGQVQRQGWQGHGTQQGQQDRQKQGQGRRQTYGRQQPQEQEQLGQQERGSRKAPISITYRLTLPTPQPLNNCVWLPASVFRELARRRLQVRPEGSTKNLLEHEMQGTLGATQMLPVAWVVQVMFNGDVPPVGCYTELETLPRAGRIYLGCIQRVAHSGRWYLDGLPVSGLRTSGHAREVSKLTVSPDGSLLTVSLRKLAVQR